MSDKDKESSGPSSGSRSVDSKELEEPKASDKTSDNSKPLETSGKKESPFQYASNIKVPHGTTVLFDIHKRVFYAKSGSINDQNSAQGVVYPTVRNGLLELHPLEEFKKSGNGYQVICGNNQPFDHSIPSEGFLLEVYHESHYNPPATDPRAAPKTVDYDNVMCDLTNGKFYQQSSMKRVYPFVRYPEQVMIFRPIPLLVRSQSGAQVPLHESLGHAVVSSDETGQDQFYYHYAPPQPIKLVIKAWNPDSLETKK